MHASDTIRGYQLIEEIGRGSFATVWRAHQPSVARDVAVKVIHPELASQPDFVRRFEVEAHLVARLEHPHVVSLVDYWRDGDRAQLVMQYLRGGTLDDRLDDGLLDPAAVRRLVVEIGSALAAAHERGIVHRDVKPANVLFDEHGYAHLTDFGIAIDAVGDDTGAAARSHGSPHYAAPEQLRREQVGPGADQYALGVVAWRCLAGPPPLFSATSGPELYHRQLTEPLPDLREHGVDADLAAALARATAKDPDERFDSVRELMAAVDRSRNPAPPPATSVVNPYRGLRAFDEADADAFFGRDRLVHELLGGLGAGQGLGARAAVVVGASGSGKSSVVRAGLVPALRRGGVAGSDRWFVTTATPGDDPFAAVAAALARVGNTTAERLEPLLRSGPRGLVRAVRSAVGADATVLLVLDQMEELFTLAPTEDADALLEVLAFAIREPTSRFRLVGTLRADYYDRPLRHPAFAPVFKAVAVDVTPLEPDELEEALVEPARRAGLTLEAGLLGQIVADTAGRAAPLPLLQYAMAELFDRRSGTTLTTAAYVDAGGVGGALAAGAERLYADASPPERTALRRVLGRLASVDADGTDLRVPVRVPDLGDDQHVRAVLDALGGARLVTFDRDPATRDPTVEVAHEELLRSWPRLVDWLDRDRDLRRRVDLLATRADEWDRAGRSDADALTGSRLADGLDLVAEAPDRLREVDRAIVGASDAAAARRRTEQARRVRNLRRLAGATAVALAIALVAAAIAIGQRTRAEEQAEAAAAEADRADVEALISRSAALGVDDPSLGVLLALEANRQAPGPTTEQAVLASLVAMGPRVSSQPAFGADLGPCDTDGDISDDGTEQYASVDGRRIRVDIATGRREDVGPLADPCGQWLLFHGTDRDLEIDADARRFTVRRDGEIAATIEAATDGSYAATSRAGSPRIAIVPSGLTVDAVEVQLHDADTGQAIGPAITGLVRPSVAFSPDGRWLVISSGTRAAPDGGGPLIVVDQETGAEVHRLDLPHRAPAIGFDPTGDAALLGAADGLTTVDLDAGEVVDRVLLPDLQDLRSVVPVDDHTVAVLAAGRLELVDPASGLLDGAGIELRGAGESVLRPDGTVLIHTEEHRNEIIDIDGGPLVERWVATGATTSWVEVNHGRMAITDVATGSVDVVDLSSDARTSLDLRLPDGSPAAAIVASPLPNPDELLTIAGDASVSRWRDDQHLDTYRAVDGVLEGGAGVDGFLALLVGKDRRYTAVLVSTDGPLRELLRIPDLEEATAVAATAEGGLHVAFDDGRVESYDASGRRTGIAEGGVCCTEFARLDDRSGEVVFGGGRGVMRLDPTSGSIDVLDLETSVSNVGVAGADRLVVGRRDGTVQLWDAASGSLVGTLLDATTNGLGTPRLERATASVWVPVAGRAVLLPVEPARWIELACRAVGRELTAEEREAHVPDGISAESDATDPCAVGGG